MKKSAELLYTSSQILEWIKEFKVNPYYTDTPCDALADYIKAHLAEEVEFAAALHRFKKNNKLKHISITVKL